MFFTEPSATTLFGHAGTITMAGWIVLAIAIAFRLKKLRDWVPGLAVPLILSTLYTAIIGIHWWGAEGGFSSLESVAKLFQSEWILLAGWVHYLAYDLFIGTWIARDAETRNIPRWALIPVLPLAFLFGPAGFVVWIMLRSAFQPAIQETRA